MRPTGESAPTGAPVGAAQFFWLWAPVNFPSLSTHFDSNEYGDGRRWHEVGAIVRPDGAAPESMRAVDYRIDWRPGTRWAQAFEYDLVDWDGRIHTVKLVPQYEFQMSGLGYGHPEFGHGMWNGESVVAAERFALPVSMPCTRRHLHVQAVCDATYRVARRSDGARHRHSRAAGDRRAPDGSDRCVRSLPATGWSTRGIIAAIAFRDSEEANGRRAAQ